MGNESSEARYISIMEACDYFCVSRSLIRKTIKEGRAPTIRQGSGVGRVFLEFSHLEAMANEFTRTGANKRRWAGVLRNEKRELENKAMAETLPTPEELGVKPSLSKDLPLPRAVQAWVVGGALYTTPQAALRAWEKAVGEEVVAALRDGIESVAALFEAVPPKGR